MEGRLPICKLRCKSTVAMGDVRIKSRPETLSENHLSDHASPSLENVNVRVAVIGNDAPAVCNPWS